MVVCEMVVRKELNLYTLSQFMDLKTRAFALNYLIYFALINFFYILPRKMYYLASIVVSSLLILFSIANQMKLELRNSPITLSDIQNNSIYILLYIIRRLYTIYFCEIGGNIC